MLFLWHRSWLVKKFKQVFALLDSGYFIWCFWITQDFYEAFELSELNPYNAICVRRAYRYYSSWINHVDYSCGYSRLESGKHWHLKYFLFYCFWFFDSIFTFPFHQTLPNQPAYLFKVSHEPFIIPFITFCSRCHHKGNKNFSNISWKLPSCFPGSRLQNSNPATRASNSIFNFCTVIKAIATAIKTLAIRIHNEWRNGRGSWRSENVLLYFQHNLYISWAVESLDNLMHQISADTGFFHKLINYLQYRSARVMLFPLPIRTKLYKWATHQTVYSDNAMCIIMNMHTAKNHTKN